jgi:hypothetical protein
METSNIGHTELRLPPGGQKKTTVIAPPPLPPPPRSIGTQWLLQHLQLLPFACVANRAQRPKRLICLAFYSNTVNEGLRANRWKWGVRAANGPSIPTKKSPRPRRTRALMQGSIA